MNPIPEFPGYLVTDDGRIWSEKSSRWLKGSVDHKGYRFVSLHRDGRGHTRRVHVLAAGAFLGERPADKPHIRHLDGDQTNNTVGNLKYGTNLENVQDAIVHGTHCGAVTHCPQGHPYSGANLHVRPDGKRQCRTCRRRQTREAGRTYRRRQKAQLPLAA